MQILKYKSTNTPVSPKQPQKLNQQPLVTSARTERKSYSQEVANMSEINNQNRKQNQNDSVHNALQKIMEKLTEMVEHIGRLEYSP